MPAASAALISNPHCACRRHEGWGGWAPTSRAGATALRFALLTCNCYSGPFGQLRDGPNRLDGKFQETSQPNSPRLFAPPCESDGRQFILPRPLARCDAISSLSDLGSAMSPRRAKKTHAQPRGVFPRSGEFDAGASVISIYLRARGRLPISAGATPFRMLTFRLPLPESPANTAPGERAVLRSQIVRASRTEACRL